MQNITNKHLLGAHLSISGGLHQAIIQAEKIGCTAVQFFSKSNRQWYAKPLEVGEVELFKQTVQQSTIQSVMIHASYLINIGSPDKAASQKAFLALKDEFIRAQQLDADYLVFHPGSHKQTDVIECLNQIATYINHIFDQTEHTKTKLLIETMAGQGSSVGHTFEQLAHIYQRVQHKDRLGICLDTCHVFAAGYDIGNQDGYMQTLQQFTSLLGLDTLCAMHINDSKKQRGSLVDRHEHIGKGAIGLPTFEDILNDPRLVRVPKILETPLDHPDDHEKNLRILQGLILDR